MATTNEERQRMQDTADVASWMLAAEDEREALATVMDTIPATDAPRLLMAAIELGGSLVRYSGEIDARAMLQQMIPALRSTAAELDE